MTRKSVKQFFLIAIDTWMQSFHREGGTNFISMWLSLCNHATIFFLSWHLKRKKGSKNFTCYLKLCIHTITFWNLDKFCIILNWCIFILVGVHGLLCVKWLIWITEALRKHWYTCKNFFKITKIYRKSICRNPVDPKPSQKKNYQKYGKIPLFHVKTTVICVILGNFCGCDVTYFEIIFITKRNIENPPHEGLRNVLFFDFLMLVHS